MAGDNEIEVGIGVVGSDLESQLKRVFDLMSQGATRAEMIRGSLESWGAATRVLPERIARVSALLEKMGSLRDTASNTARKSALEETLERETEKLTKANNLLRENAELQKISSIASGAAKRDAGNRTLSDGRTLNEARASEAALRDAITGINTTEQQLTARLSIATGKAMERLLTSTTVEMERSLKAAEGRLAQREAAMSKPGYMTAQVINAGVRAESSIALAQTGATLADRQAFADGNRNARAQAINERATAELQNRRVDAGIKQQQLNERAEAEQANKNLDASARRAALNERANAEQDNKNREERAKVIARNIRLQAEQENKNIEASAKQAALNERAEAEQANKNITAKVRQAAINERAEAEQLNKNLNARARGSALNQRYEAEGENRRMTPEAASRLANQESAFAKKYGVERNEFIDRIKGENLSIKDQSVLLRGLADDVRAANIAKNAAGPKKEPLTPQQRVAAQVDNRNMLMDSNGGADMFAFQAKLAANYAIFGLITSAISGSIAAIVQFDEGLKQFQAITSTADSEMGSFRANLLGIAADSKFSVTDLTQVAVALGQTGLAADGVIKALRPVVNLAAASGASLQESVEAITAVLGAYNMEASRAGDVADIFVAALNRTKLTMGQLQLGIQYAANIARDSGVSFSELTASIGAMSQAGVKSGSTIGTGIRQLITELSSPTDKLRGVFKELGIDLADVDLRTQGFTSVLETLRTKGFGTAEALRSLDLRAAAAFSSLSGQADKIKLLEQEFLLTSAATESAAKANESFTASGQRLTNTVFALVDKAIGPLVTVMAKAAGTTADLIGKMGDLGPTLPIIAAGLGSIAAAAAAIKIGSLVAGLVSLPAIGSALAAAAPLAAGIAVGGGLIYYLSTLQSEADKAREKLDQLKGLENGLMARQGALATASGDLDLRIKTLIDRRDKLNEDPILRRNAIIDAQKAFAEFGLTVDVGANSIEGLITALQKLRTEMGQEVPALLAQQLTAITGQIEKLQKIEQEREARNRPGLRSMGPSFMGMGTMGTVDPNEALRGLGPQGNAVADYLSGKTQIDAANPRGGAVARLFGDLSSERVTLGQSRDAVATYNEPGPERDRLLSAIDARILLVDEAIKRFTEKVAAVTNQQALVVAQGRIQSEIRARAIAAQPGSVTKDDFDAIRGQQDEAIRAAERTGGGGIGRYEAMQQAARTTDDVVKAKLDQIKAAKEKAISEGATKAEADMAFHEVSDQLQGLLKGSTKEIRDRFVAAEPAARAGLQAQIRNAEAQLALIQRQASMATDPDRVTDLAGLAADYQNTINTARAKLFKLDQGPNAQSVIDSNPELREKADALRQSGDAAVTKLGLDYAEIHRKVQEQVLTFQVSKQNERKDLIESQIKGLEKIRDDARSSPEQAAAAVREINRLLGEVAKILQGINTLKADKTDLKVPDTIGPTAAYTGGSAQDYILKSLKDSGASEQRIRYALASGQIESGYREDVVSGAKRSSTGAAGVFQFMPSTWNKMYGTNQVDTSLPAQLKAFQEFTNRNAGTFQSNMGREASAEELYLMHQQGAAGAMSLLRAGSSGSALDALTAARGGGADARRYAGQAITANGGSLDMTGEEFANAIMRKFRSAEGAVGNPFSTTGQAEQLRSRQATKDKTDEDIQRRRAENEKAGDEAARASRLAQLKKDDKALSETYDTQLNLARRVQDPAANVQANRDAYDTLGKLFEKAKETDNTRAEREGPEERANTAAGTRKRYAELYQQQGLNSAEVAGKTLEKQYTDELTRLQNMKKELERPENTGREGNTDLLNSLNAQINTLEKRNQLEGAYEQNQAKIVALEETLRQMKEKGLDTDKDTLSVRERLRDLYDKNKQLEPSRNFAGTQARTERTYGEAARGASDSFLKSRGILDMQGNVVDPVVRAQKTLEESLGAIGSSFDSLWTNLVSGSMTAGQALKTFATSVLSGVMSSISKSLTSDIMKGLLGTGKGDDTGIFSSIISAFTTKANGGLIRMAGGGAVNRDSVPIMAMPGEYLLRKSAVEAIGKDKLDSVNALGGAMESRAPKMDTAQKFGGAQAQADIYIVDRDQVPPPGRDQIVHMIGDNIQRGGALKQLIKSVATGRG